MCESKHQMCITAYKFFRIMDDLEVGTTNSRYGKLSALVDYLEVSKRNFSSQALDIIKKLRMGTFREESTVDLLSTTCATLQRDSDFSRAISVFYDSIFGGR